MTFIFKMDRVFDFEERFLAGKEIDVSGEVQVSQTPGDSLLSTAIRSDERNTCTWQGKVGPVVKECVAPLPLDAVHEHEHRNVSLA